MDQFENQLRKWALRRPAPQIARKLFAPNACSPSHWFSWSWLAPVASAAMLAGLLVVQQQVLFPHAHSAKPQAFSFSGSLANPLSQSYADAASAGDWNVVSAILEWTNTRPSHSSNGSFLLFSTNSLRN